MQRVAPERDVVLDDVAEVAQAYHLAVGLLDRHLREVALGHDGLNIAHVHALVARLDEAACADRERLRELEDACVERIRGRLHHVGQRDAVLREELGIDLDVPLLEPLTVDEHVGHAGDALRRCLIFQ